MITTAAHWYTVDPNTCLPTYYGSRNRWGSYANVRKLRTNLGKHWHWSGTPPHNTRMHQYGGLTSGQKAAWKAWGAAMQNNHTPAGISFYSGSIAYMQINLMRRLQGAGYTYTAPTVGSTVPFTQVAATCSAMPTQTAYLVRF